MANRYGEDIPPDRSTLLNWVATRLDTWSKAAGLEAFPDDNRNDGGVSLMIGGKVLVLDVELVNTTATVKVSFASGEGEGSGGLAVLLTKSVQTFLDEVYRDDGARDPIAAGLLGEAVAKQLAYLSILDKLAESGSMAWFSDGEKVFKIARDVSFTEAGRISSPKAALDILLLRGHALPLHYTIFPSISFMIYASPNAYFSLTRSSPNSPGDPFDVSYDFLRQNLPINGVYLSTLKVAHAPSRKPASSRHQPNFSLLTAPPPNYVFPVPPESSNLSWVLEFNPPLVTSQARMRAIQSIVSPGGNVSGGDNGLRGRLRELSWIDMLLNSPSPVEVYTASYFSPSSAHPPLRLRLTNPSEPGFLLEQVPVQNIHQAYTILGVVKEQCWLNEIILSCQWRDEADHIPNQDSTITEPTDQDLEEILSGSIQPTTVPVNLHVPVLGGLYFENDNPFPPLPGSLSLKSQPRLLINLPRKPRPFEGFSTGDMNTMLSITAGLDEDRKTGIWVKVGWTPEGGYDEKAEEMCRRGGLFSVAGRVYMAQQ